MLTTKTFRPHEQAAYISRQKETLVIVLIKTLILLLRSIFRSFQLKDKNYSKSKTIIVSHFLGANAPNKSNNNLFNDNYFGDVMTFSKKYDISMGYLLHENSSENFINAINYVSIPFFLKSILEVIKNLYLNKRIFEYYKFYHSHDILDWMIAFAILDYAKKAECSHVIFTFEGNIWEHNLIQKLATNNIKSIGYFHGPLRVGFLENLVNSGYNMPNLLLLKSNHEAKLFSRILPEREIKIVGSHRKTAQSKLQTKKLFDITNIRFLIAPEGLPCEVKTHIDFAIHIKRMFPRSKVKFRFHPNYDSSKDTKLLTQMGIGISTKTLDYDLSQSDFCVYRGSTVCFQALSNSCIPVYLLLAGENCISPLLFLLNEKLPIVDPADVGTWLSKYNENSYYDELKDLQKYLKDYPNESRWDQILVELENANT